MKQRIISGAIGAVVLLVVLAMYNTLVLTAAIAAVVALASFEMVRACGVLSCRPFSIAVIVMCTAVPLSSVVPSLRLLGPALFVYVFVVFCMLLKYHDKLRVDHAGFAAFMAFFVSCSLSCVVWLRDDLGSELGLYALAITLISAWVSDTGAYFSGYFFGKHKLCPSISPKKTIEGAIGGIVCVILAQLLAIFVFESVTGHVVFIVPMLVWAPLFAVMGIIGDLSASVIKRHFGIKDYGNIMPGHGGALDRFGSVIMVLPAVYIMFIYREILPFTLYA